MSKRRLFYFLLPAALAAAFSACDSGTEVEKKEALSAVNDYNTMLQMAYMQADLNVMLNFATEKQIRKVFPTIQALQSMRNSMVAEQSEFTVKRVSVKETTASVRTRETWRYLWQSIDTGSITKPEQTVTYTIKYNLVKQQGKWKVDSLEED